MRSSDLRTGLAATGRRRALLMLLAVTGLLGLACVLLVPAGLPYDEPSHWLNVQFYAAYGRMPELGDSRVSYEAQMGPVAYVIRALIFVPIESLAGERFAFYAVRLVGLVEFVIFLWLLWCVLGRILPDHPSAVLAATGVLALNPMLIVMAGSVQNDTCSLALAMASMEVAFRGATAGRGAVAGALGGFAVLAKVTSLPLLAAVAVYYATRRRWTACIAYMTGAVLVAGWWFVRNVRLYGDVSGRAGVEQAGFIFPPLDGGPVVLVRDAVTYLWLPTEYLRNQVVSPPVLDMSVILATIVVLAGGTGLWWKRKHVVISALATVLGTGGLAIAGWVALTLNVQGVAFRFAYVALPAWAVLVTGTAVLCGARRRLAQAVSIVAAGVSVAVLAWVLISVRSPGPRAFDIPL